MADNDDSALQRTLEHAFEIWINPEIERRRAVGRWPTGVRLVAAQVIMNVDAPLEVRLNGEVKVIVRLPPRGSKFKVGDAIPIDWDEVAEVQLGPDDPNAGHLTIVRDNAKWRLTFDFRYNAERANDCLDASREFLATATHALAQGLMRAFAENLFGTVELAVKARLLTLPDNDVLKTKKHALVAGKYNRWVKLGNAPKDSATLLNTLQLLRAPGRYLRGQFALSLEDAQEMLDRATELVDGVAAELPSRRSL